MNFGRECVAHLMRLCEEVGRAPGVKDLEVSIWEAGREVLPKYFII